MLNGQLLRFISNADLYEHTNTVIIRISKATKDAQANLYKNSIDPFSAIFDAMTKGITVEDWLLQESGRQVQKTMQNAIGDFDQNILGSVRG